MPSLTRFIYKRYLELFKDVKQHLNSTNITDAKKSVVIQRLFSLGLTHSLKSHSLFGDRYQREGVDFDDTKHGLYAAATTVLNQTQSLESFYLPVINKTMGCLICKELSTYFRGNRAFRYTEITLQDGEVIPCLQVETNNKCLVFSAPDFSRVYSSVLKHDEVVEFLGHKGCLATKDQLLKIFAACIKDGDLCAATQEKFIRAMEFTFNDLFAGNISVIKLDVQSCKAQSSHKLRNELKLSALYNKLSKLAAKKMPDLIATDALAFYSKLILDMVRGLKLSQASLRDDIILRSLVRIQDDITFSLNAINFPEFILGIEFAIDEIILLLSYLQLYSERDIFLSLRNHWRVALDLSEDYPIQSVFIAGSGMQVLYSLYSETTSYIRTKYQASPQVLITNSAYYELAEATGIFGFETKDVCALVHADKYPEVKDYVGTQLIDIIITSINDNMRVMTPGFQSRDVNYLIQQQLDLRKHQNSERQLILILDSTLTDPSDVELNLIIEVYKEYILKGTMAILLVHSMNKFMQLGLDKNAAGVGVCLFDPKAFAFPELIHDRLIGYKHVDATPQFIAHMLNSVPRAAFEFYVKLCGINRFLHEAVLPKSLRFGQNTMVQIDDPYTQDIYKNIWTFIGIRFHPNLDRKVQSILHDQLWTFLKSLGIALRDGFAFSQTHCNGMFMDPLTLLDRNGKPYVAIVGALRISIGLDASLPQFDSFVRFLLDLNAYLESELAATLQDKKLKIDYVAVERYIQNLGQNYVPNKPKVKTVPRAKNSLKYRT